MDATINQDEKVHETFLVHKKKMDVFLVVPQTVSIIFGILILWFGKAHELGMATTAWLIIGCSLLALILHFYLQATLENKNGYNFLPKEKLLYRFTLRELEVFAYSYVAYPAGCVLLERLLGLNPLIPYPYRWYGLVIFIPATIMMTWVLWVFVKTGRGTPVPFEATQKLIIVGPYRYVRNPMEIAAFFMMIGLAIILSSYFFFISAFLTTIQFHLYTIKIEEPEMYARFGTEFENYVKRVRRWMPRLK